jgi:hypothetical protein
LPRITSRHGVPILSNDRILMLVPVMRREADHVTDRVFRFVHNIVDMFFRIVPLAHGDTGRAVRANVPADLVEFLGGHVFPSKENSLIFPVQKSCAFAAAAQSSLVRP